jgi:hypothetical protein
MQPIAEQVRLTEDQERTKYWKRWGPYLSERAWGTVREDYSPNGTAWEYFPHDAARSRVYRWTEDGIMGICDNHQYLCFALAFWNGKDSILKERLFGLTGNEGNHGEDVKELYYYLEATPTNSYLKGPMSSCSAKRSAGAGSIPNTNWKTPASSTNGVTSISSPNMPRTMLTIC